MEIYLQVIIKYVYDGLRSLNLLRANFTSLPYMSTAWSYGLASVSLMAAGMALSMWAVLVDGVRAFPLPSQGRESVSASSSSYWTSPYWVGIPVPVAKVVTALQVVAFVGSCLWIRWALVGEAAPPGTVFLMHGFLLSWTIWPFVTYLHVSKPPMQRSVLTATAACVPLWTGGAFVTGMVVVSSLARDWLSIVGSSSLFVVAVLVDGVMWSYYVLIGVWAGS